MLPSIYQEVLYFADRSLITICENVEAMVKVEKHQFLVLPRRVHKADPKVLKGQN